MRFDTCVSPAVRNIEGGRRGEIYPYLLQIHGFHGVVHALNHIHHAPRDLSHRNSSLYPARDGIDPAPQPK